MRLWFTNIFRIFGLLINSILYEKDDQVLLQKLKNPELYK